MDLFLWLALGVFHGPEITPKKSTLQNPCGSCGEVRMCLSPVGV